MPKESISQEFTLKNMEEIRYLFNYMSKQK